MAFIHKYTQIYPGNPEGRKPALELHTLSLFLSLHYIKCLQYNIRFQPSSETLIPILKLENHESKNPIPWTAKPLTIIPPKTTQNFFFSGAPPPNPQIHVADNGFRANAWKTDRGGPSELPPSGAGASGVGLVELGLRLHAKNIT